MKDLLLRHYIAIKNRGLITPETTLDQFMMKLNEEAGEVFNAYADDLLENKLPSSDLIRECTSLIAVITDMFTHFNISFEDEMKYNIKIQESRK